MLRRKWGVALFVNEAEKIIDKANVIITQVQAGEAASGAGERLSTKQHIEMPCSAA